MERRLSVWITHIQRRYLSAAEDSYQRLIEPAIEREIRSDLTEMAEEGAIRVFGKNLTSC